MGGRMVVRAVSERRRFVPFVCPAALGNRPYRDLSALQHSDIRRRSSRGGSEVFLGINMP